jgi:hypothetical protein
MTWAAEDYNIRESDPRRRFRHQTPSRLSRLRPPMLVFAPISSAYHIIYNSESEWLVASLKYGWIELANDLLCYFCHRHEVNRKSNLLCFMFTGSHILVVRNL